MDVPRPGQPVTARESARIDLLFVSEVSSQVIIPMQIYRRPEIERRLGISRSTVYLWLRKGQFPPPIKLGQRAIGWRASDIEAWLGGRVNAPLPPATSEK